MTMLLDVEVDGQAVPQGSMSPFIHHRTGRVVTPQKKSVLAWRDTVAAVARANYRGDPTPDPVRVILAFELTRPRSHYGTGRNDGQLKPSAPMWCVGRPDLDKLCRAVLDALTGVIWCDDSQVVDIDAGKAWSTCAPYTRIEVQSVGALTERVG